MTYKRLAMLIAAAWTFTVQSGCVGKSVLGIEVTITDERSALEQEALGQRVELGKAPRLLPPTVRPPETPEARQVMEAALARAKEALEELRKPQTPINSETGLSALRLREWECALLLNIGTMNRLLGSAPEAKSAYDEGLAVAERYCLWHYRWKLQYAAALLIPGHEGLKAMMEAAKSLEEAPVLHPVEHDPQALDITEQLYGQIVASLAATEGGEADALGYAEALEDVRVPYFLIKSELKFGEPELNQHYESAQKLRGRLIALQSTLCNLNPPAAQSKTPGERDDFSETRGALMQALETYRKHIAKRIDKTSYIALLQPTRTDLSALPEFVGGNSVYLRCFSSGGDVIVWLVTPDDFQMSRKPWTSPDVADRLMSCDDSRKLSEADRTAISDSIITPIKGMIPEGTKRLYICFGKELSGVPWAALPYDGTTIGAKFQLGLVNGSSLFLQATLVKSFNKRNLLFCAYGDSQSGAYGEQVGKLWSGGWKKVDSANDGSAGMAERAFYYSLIHFQNPLRLNPGDPARSAIVFPGQLSSLSSIEAYRLTGWNLRGNTLTICRTSAPLSPKTYCAHSLTTRLLFLAGVPTVVMADGPVTTDSETAFMSAFYPEMKSKEAGEAFAEALAHQGSDLYNYRLWGFLGLEPKEREQYAKAKINDLANTSIGNYKQSQLPAGSPSLNGEEPVAYARKAAVGLAELVDFAEVVTFPGSQNRVDHLLRMAGAEAYQVGCWLKIGDFDQAVDHQENRIAILLKAKAEYEAMIAKPDADAKALAKWRIDDAVIAREKQQLGILLTNAERFSEAVATTQEGVEIYRGAGRGDKLPVAVSQLASAQEQASEYREALTNFQRSLEMYNEMGELGGVAVQYRNIGRIYLKRLNNYLLAEESFAKANEAFEEQRKSNLQALMKARVSAINEEETALKAEARAGMADATEADRKTAENARKVSDHARSEVARLEAAVAADEKDITLSIIEIGLCRRESADFPAAFDRFEQARKRAEERNDREGVCQALLHTGETHWYRSEFQMALDLQDESGKIADELKLSHFRILGRNLLGLIYWELNDYLRADINLRDALQMAQDARSRLDVASIYNNLGILYRRQKKYDQALEAFRQAYRIDAALKSKWGMAYDERNMGITYHRLARYDEASAAILRAISLSESISDKINLCKAHFALGDLLLERGDVAGAEENFKKSLDISRSLCIRDVQWRSLRGLGIIRRKAGALADAAALYKEGVEVVEETRAELRLEELRNGFLENKLDLYEELVVILLDMGDNAEAFRYCERSRARSFMDLFANQKLTLRGETDQKLFERQQELAVQIRRLEEALGRAETPETAQSLKQNLDDVRVQYQDLLRDIRAASPQLSSFVSVDVITIDKLNEILGQEVTLLEFYLTGDELIVWLLRSGGMEVVRTKLDREAFNRDVQDYRVQIQERIDIEEIRRKSARINDIVIRPIEEKIAGSRYLCIVPHRVLHYLSFASLYDGQSYLLDRYPLFYTPSASVLSYTIVGEPKKGDRKILAIGNPDLGNPAFDLPFAEKEVNSMERDIPGVTVMRREQATESWVSENISKFNVIHFASHGEFDGVNPLFSAILLAPDKTNNGRLEAHEVTALDLRADLITLSACQSGLGKIQAGDEVIGLNRAFMYAGTRSILSTLWRVNDVSTAILIKHFYRNYATESKTDSLRSAALMVKRYYPHPSDWAPFSITGDYR